ncbi:hypothetical protein PIB30_080459 [Stylosanthes scabra]|uniref:Uncharacterized protein n=1 Tax=Stylosanthes scabra TaxID=79078 RepID=A0ABU6UU31_9FABA|nr:hypothetical protein [Stylosanthes scabra]
MQLSIIFPNAFPINTVVNPMVECYAITIKNGEALQDSKQDEAMQEFQAKQGRYDVLDDTNQDFVMLELDAIMQKNIAKMKQECNTPILCEFFRVQAASQPVQAAPESAPLFLVTVPAKHHP